MINSNVIIINCDDLRCYGKKLYNTPNIYNIAKEGMLFADFYEASPSRGALLTGCGFNEVR